MRIRALLWVFVLPIILFSCKEEPLVTEEDKDKNPEFCRVEPLAIYQSCVSEPDASTLDVATWNIEFFPQQGDKTVTAVKNIINSLQADIIAVQEINNVSEFNNLADVLPGWEAQVFENGALSLGFIYNSCEIISTTEIEPLNIGGPSSFPRNPVKMAFEHQNGLQVTLINVHLKCCDNGYYRRIEASLLMKDYLDAEHPNDNVVVLGDFNDRINGEDPPFQNFINDSENYTFADMVIAQGSTENYSYPGWPSHIDHTLITNELFDNVSRVSTVKLDNCYNSYYSVVSDHRPVILSLLNE